MKLLMVLTTLFMSTNSFAYTVCLNQDDDSNRCLQEIELADQGSVDSLNSEINRQGQALLQTEKRLKADLIKLIAESRKQIVVDLLNDPEMRDVIKEKIRLLEAK